MAPTKHTTLPRKRWRTNERFFKVVVLVIFVIDIIVCAVFLIVNTNGVDAGSTVLYSGDVVRVSTPPLGEEDLEVAMEAYTARRTQAIAERVAMGEDSRDEELRAFSNLTVSRERVEAMVASLETSETADFDVTKLLRLLQYTSEFDEVILPTLEKILAWPAKGNTKTQYVYWSENHSLMWQSAIQLTNEWYGWPGQEEEQHKSRLKFFLRQKIDHGYIEFFSTTYMPFTFAAIANLYDFSRDVEIQELAQGAATRLLRDLDLMTNDKGGQFTVAGRDYKDVVESSKNDLRTMGWLLTGRGSDVVDASKVRFGTGSTALVTTALDVASVLSNPIVEADIVRETGHNRDEFLQEWGDLNVHDKQLVGMSMGGYAHPDYVVDLFSTLNYYDLWGSKYFMALKPIRWLPPKVLRFAANVASTYGSSTLLHAQIILHKYKTSMLSTLQDYHKGLNGEQQWPFMASVGSAPIYIATGGDYKESRNPSVHLPYATQKQNVALLVYSPNSDLKLFSSRDKLDVKLVWPEDSFSEVSVERGNWIVGREDSSYVAVYRNCLDVDNDGRPTCSSTKQVWACVVGHQDIHGSFEDFLTMLDDAVIGKSFGKGGFVAASVRVDGQDISIVWNQGNYGPAKRALILVVILVVLVMAFSIFAVFHIKPRRNLGRGRSSRQWCCRLKIELQCFRTKAGAGLCLCLVLPVVIFSLGLVAILRLAKEGNPLPSVVPNIKELGA